MVLAEHPFLPRTVTPYESSQGPKTGDPRSPQGGPHCWSLQKFPSVLVGQSSVTFLGAYLDLVSKDHETNFCV